MTSRFTLSIYNGHDLVKSTELQESNRKVLEYFYNTVKKENPIVRAGGSRALNYVYGPDVWYLVITDTATQEWVGGAIWEYWDSHVENCLSVNAALVLPEYRHSAATAILWRTIKAYAMGCKWICTTQYRGNCSYITKYREVKL